MSEQRVSNEQLQGLQAMTLPPTMVRDIILDLLDARAEIEELQDRLDREVACNEANCKDARKHRAAREKAERELARVQAVVEAARKGLAAVRNLIDDSRGVTGLHLNGDVAPWDELLAGGQFEDWLFDFSAAGGAFVDYDAAKEGR